MKNYVITISLIVLLTLTECTYNAALNRTLESSGSNRSQLESVLEHYKFVDPNAQKFDAARFLIENMPAHYSYFGTRINEYYNYAASILIDRTLTPEQQRDSLLFISDSLYADLPTRTISDEQIITADYLISNIDKSYTQWTTCPWCSQITFEEYLEWLLPYKGIEMQELDAWRDTMLAHFSDGLNHPIKNDVEYNTTIGVADMLRNEAQTKIKRYGLYSRAGLPLLSANLLPRQTYGNIPDYALMAVLLMRSAGIPAILDETPVGSRYTAATRWFVIIDDRGKEQASEWDLSTNIGWGFFPYERAPKVFRNTYAINKERWEYRQNSKYLYPFELGKKDVTEQYFLTSDLSLFVNKRLRKNLKEKYVYIASSIRNNQNLETISVGRCHEPSGWQVVDFGVLKHSHAYFRKMGREVLYKAFGYDGKELIPVTAPFILHKDGRIEYVSEDTINSQYLDKWKNNAL